jgi:glycosyltransferase involved in cell wall biosynthesis
LNYIQKLKINLLTAIGIHEKNAIQNSLLTIGLGNYLKEHFNNKNIMIIQNGIDPIKWKPLDRMQARYQLGYNENDFILLFIGRVLPIKGVDILINAIRQLGPNYKDLYAIVIGSLGQSFENRNEINPYAKKMLQESKSLPIEFKGFISNQSNEFRNFIAAADFLVLPSVFEPQGNVILEAMSMEVPVLASATGGIKDIIHEKVGKLFKSGDFMQLASLLKYYYFNRDDIWDMKKNCRSYVEKNFTWDISAKKHIHAFKNLSKLNYSLRQNL